MRAGHETGDRGYCDSTNAPVRGSYDRHSYGVILDGRFSTSAQALLCRCLHRLLTSPEATEMFMKAKGLDVVLAALSRHAADVDVVRHCCETLRLLAGDDELKKTVLGHLSTLVQLAERHQQRTAVLGPIFGTYAILALRSPEIQTQMCTLAGPCVHMQLIRALNMELEKGAARASKAEAAASIGFLCKAVHALRNVVSRSEEARAAALEEGAEATLRQVYVYPRADDVFAALRDLMHSSIRWAQVMRTKAQTYRRRPTSARRLMSPRTSRPRTPTALVRRAACRFNV